MHGCVDMYTWATEARRGLRSLESEAAGWYEQPHLSSGTQLRSPARARSPCTTNPSLQPRGVFCCYWRGKVSSVPSLSWIDIRGWMTFQGVMLFETRCLGNLAVHVLPWVRDRYDASLVSTRLGHAACDPSIPTAEAGGPPQVSLDYKAKPDSDW